MLQPKNVALVVFPGTNRHEDMHKALTTFGDKVTQVAHTQRVLPEQTQLVVLPGGFSYGDYLRAGAIAARTPIMQAVAAYARAGGVVLGICNGFQILCEAGLLPGALLPNVQGQFIGNPLAIEVVNTGSIFSGGYKHGQVVHWPAAHGDGRYVLDYTQPRPTVLYRYVHNINGSAEGIAGICNTQGNVFGMMPHPENALNLYQGMGADGAAFFQHILQAS